MPSWIVIGWALTFGYMPLTWSSAEPRNYDAPAFEQTIELEARVLDHVRAWTEVETRDYAYSLTEWFPYQARYRIGIELFAQHLSLGIMHECIHQVVNRSFDINFGAMETQVYVRIASR
jgi:hypothetical protein